MYQSANPRTKFRPQPCKAAERQARGISSIVPTILLSALKTSFLLSTNFHAATASVSTMGGGAFNGAADRVVFHDGLTLSPCSPGWGLGMYKMLSSDDAHSRTLSSFHF